MAATLADFPFIYLYFRPDSADAPVFRSIEQGQSQPNLPVPDEHRPAVQRLGAAITAMKEGDPECVLEFEGVRCRLSRETMADGTNWVCARRINTSVPALDKLGFAKHISDHLHGLGQRAGLILIAGASGQGKTTTAVALLVDFLTSYGGTAVAIEDPIEYNLQGRHGEKGHCFQIEPESDDDWAVCLKRALSWAPDYIFAGEFRTPKVAEILLRASTTGHTVITTVDAGTPEDALTEVLFLGEKVMGSSSNTILAQGMTALAFQSMKEDGPFIRYLFTEENAPGDPIRTLIRENKVTMISTYIDRIAARLSNQPQALPPIGKMPPLAPGSLPPLPPLPRKS
ncbi:MAG: ATPase, T2SS/T4P/T4SS family [Alphaproteobacteria bacterium]|nr:ATPase, T2SS/T4P/T4SS family [Alphaproteobacteria bacterium]